jgi:nucleosome assembly protein 1-like 1
MLYITHGLWCLQYEALEAPIFKKRAAIVSGETKPDDVTDTQGIKGIPEFWLGVMRNCSIIAGNITEKDEVILHSLTNITTETLPEGEHIGFKLEFTFAENEFFTNKVLTKTYMMADTSDDPVLEKAVGTPIDWVPGKNVTVKIKKKKQRNKKGSGTRTVVKEEPCESFFNFFSPPSIPNPEEEALDEEEMEQRQMELESDYEMGIAFQERLVPHAVKWFTGEAEDEDDDYDEDDEDMEGFEDDEEVCH